MTRDLPQYENRPEYHRFADWVSSNPPCMTFKRELLKSDVAVTLQPISYPVLYSIQSPVSREEFLARPYGVFNAWGRSSDKRMELHGSFFSESGAQGSEVVSEYAHMDIAKNHPAGKVRVATIHTPWYARIPMEKVLEYQAMARISVSLNGAGAACFRHAEACLNAVMAKEDDNIAWAFPWTEENCVLLSSDKRAATWSYCLTGTAIHSGPCRLYERYLAGLRNAENYLPLNFFERHIKPKIQAVL